MRKAPRWRRWLILFLLGALLLVAAFYFDGAVQAFVLEHQSPQGKAFMGAVSRWGDWPSHTALGLLAAGIAYAAKSRRWVMIFAAMVLACALAGVTNRMVKIAAGRSRPAVTVDAGWNTFRFGSKYNAFPSGHTAASTAFFVTLCFARRRLGLSLIFIPVLVGASRVYLNAHHLSDVVAGALVGLLCAMLTWQFVSANMLDTRPRPRGYIG